MSLLRNVTLFVVLCLSPVPALRAAPAQANEQKPPAEAHKPVKPAAMQQARPAHRKQPCPKPKAGKPARSTTSGNAATTSGRQGYGESYYAAQDLRDEIARSTELLLCDEIPDDAYGSRETWDGIDGNDKQEGDKD